MKRHIHHIHPTATGRWVDAHGGKVLEYDTSGTTDECPECVAREAENERLRATGNNLAQAARVASGLTAHPKGGWYHLNATIEAWAALGEES